MGWEKGRYYTRSRKVGGRVIREYVGGGEAGEEAAQQDSLKRQQREREREEWRSEKAVLTELDKIFERFGQQADLIARAAMIAAGFHLHRGEWRRKRVRRRSDTAT